MKLFGRKNTEQQPVVPQLEQYYTEEPKWKLWVRRIVAIIVVLLIVFAIGWAAWAVYNRVTDDGSNDETIDDKNGSSQNEGGANQDTQSDSQNGSADENTSTDKQSDNTGDAATPGGTTNPDSQSGAGGSSAAPAADDANGKSAQTQQPMPNTGPADTAFIVTGAAVIGAVGHYVVSNRRATGRQ